MDFWHLQQSSRLPVKIGGSPREWSMHPSILVNVVTASPTGRPTTSTNSKTNAPVATPLPGNTKVNVPQPLMRDHRDTLLQMQWTDPFCKCIYRWLNHGKAPHYESNTFTQIDSLLYKHAMDASQKFLALVITKSWCFIVLVEAHDRLGHQAVMKTYHLVYPVITAVGPSVHADSFLYICQYCSKCLLY